MTGKNELSDLQNKIAWLEAALDLSGSCIYIKDLDGRYLYANRKVQELFGSTPEHIVGRDDFQFPDSGPAEEAQRHDRMVLEREENLDLEEKIFFESTGETRYYRVKKKAVRNPDGHLIGLCGISTDITEEKLAESRLRLWAESFEKANICIAISDAATNTFIAVNPAFAAARGYDREDLVGKNVMTVFPADIGDEVRGRIAELDRSSHLVFESEHLCKDGRRFPVSLDITSLKSADGKPVNRIAFVQDISKRKQFESELKMREKRYRAVIETSADGFCIVNLEGRLLEVNDSYIRLSGYSREELLAMRVSDLEAREDPGETAIHIRKILEEGHDRFESAHRRKDGSVWPVEIVVTYWSQFDVMFVFVVDISGRKNLERALLEHRKEMEALLQRQVAAQTAAAFAQELSQPLSAISSFSAASMMMLDAEKPDYHKIRRAIGESEKQALRAGESMHELCNLLSTGTALTEVFDLNIEIQNVLALAGKEHDLHFHTELKLEEGLSLVQANRSHVQKVLLNLLLNSVEAMHESGVPPPTALISLSTVNDGNAARVTVKDNGPGICSNDVKHLFEPFFTTKKRGIGMSLALSRSLIEANGGRLWFDPDERPGATFHLTLPFAT